MRSCKAVLSGVLLLALVAVPACAARTALVRDAVSIPSTNDRAAAVTVATSGGDLRLGGAASGLVEGEITYPPSDGKPTVESGSRDTTAGKVATVDIRQGTESPGTLGPRLIDLKLNGGLPLDLRIDAKSGNARLDLALVDVKDLGVAEDSGNLDVSLRGPHPSLSRVAIEMGSGETSVGATGEYPALERFAVVSESGNVLLDLSGTWRKSFAATVDSNSGNVTLKLPREVDLRVEGEVRSGRVSAEGFTVPPGFIPSMAISLQRPADKPSDFTLLVRVSVDSGNLTILLPEKK